MENLPILSLASLLPMMAAIIVMLINYGIHNEKYTRIITIIGGLTNIVCLVAIYYYYDFYNPALQLSEEYLILDNLDLSYHSAIDNISFSLMILNGLIDFVALIASLWMIKEHRIGFIFAFMLMPGLVNGVFTAQNLLQFFIYFEAALIPMYFMIGMWGGEDRKYAAYKFFLYTLAGSMFFLVAICYMLVTFNTLDLVALQTVLPSINLQTQIILFSGILIALLVKIPTPPLHTWLPDVHVQAPTPASALLAGILLKLGGYALIRILLPLFPEVCQIFSPYMVGLSVFAIIYGSMLAISQTDMKKMIAYSSVAHMGFVTAGIFSLTLSGLQGAMFQMISHGIVSSALFLVVGTLYDRLHTKEIDAYGGVAEKMPALGFLYLIFTLAAIGLPGTIGFVGEFIVISSLFQLHWFFSLVAAFGVVLGAMYMLSLYKRTMLGKIYNNKVEAFSDLTCIEKLFLAPLALLTIYFGICSANLLDFLQNSLKLIIAN